jgi:hypothetical protein
MPEHYPTNDEGVSKIVEARASVSAAVDPAQQVAQADEGKRLAKSSSQA